MFNVTIKTRSVILAGASFVIFTLYFSHLFLYGNECSVRIHDHLDSSIIWYKLLAQSGQIFGDSFATIPGITGGLYRFSFPSELSLMTWFFYFLPDFSAFAVNEILMHVIAFIGMILLLKEHFIPKRLPNSDIVILSTALLFALLPFWPPGGLSVSAQPLVLYAFLNIRSDRQTFKDWLILILVPFYSSFILAFSFFLSIMFALWLYDTIASRKINYRFLSAIALMCGIFLLVEYRIVYMFFIDTDFISHRTTFDTMQSSLLNAYRDSHLIFLDGHINSQNMQFRFILPLAILGLILSGISGHISYRLSAAIIAVYFAGVYFGTWGSLLTHKYTMLAMTITILLWVTLFKKPHLIAFTLLFILLSSFLYGFWSYEGFASLAERFEIIKVFNFSRFYFLHAMLWYLLAGIAFVLIIKRMKFGTLFVVSIVLFQINYSFIIRNFDYPQRDKISFRQFFDTKLFTDVKDYIGKDPANYQVACLGFHPSIAQYNGLRTLGGYTTNYSMEYKKRFRKIIAKELSKNKNIQQAFDSWGSACYMFSSEIGVNVSYNHRQSLKNLELDICALQDLKAKYILSAYPIENESNLTLLKAFQSNDSYWNLYLYEVPSIHTYKGYCGQPILFREKLYIRTKPFHYEITSHSEPHILVLMAGQSNMLGEAKDATQSRLKSDDFFDFRSSTALGTHGFGPETSLINLLKKTFPTQNFIFVKFAIGGSSLNDWLPSQPSRCIQLSSHSFKPIFTIWRENLAHILKSYVISNAVLIWMQGETDAKKQETALNYKQNMHALQDALQKILKTQHLPVILGRINPPVDRYPYVYTVRNAQENLSKELETAVLVNTDDLTKMKDNLHYDVRGQVALGKRFAEAVIALQSQMTR